VSLLLPRDLIVLSLLILAFLLVFAVMAATRRTEQRTEPNRRRPE
jgi:hypothetical protein